MDLETLASQAAAMKGMLAGLASVGSMQESTLTAAEVLSLNLLQRSLESGVPEGDVLATLAPVFQTLVAIAERDGLPLSTETETALLRFRTAGIPIEEKAPRLLSRPIAIAPRGPTDFSVFVDESGNAALDDPAQPVLCLSGIIIRDDLIPEFERRAESLLVHRGLPKGTEFHAQEFLVGAPEGPLAKLDPTARFALLRDFVRLGMEDVRVHHMSMRKAAVKPAFRQQMVAQGMNAYSHSVVWFVVTLDRACLLVTMPAQYKYFYDRTDAYRKDIGRIFRTLKQTPNKRLQLICLKGEPVQLESDQSRCIQLADVVGYYLSRYREFEVLRLAPRPELVKHEDKIREIYALIKPRLVDFIGKDLYRTVDWKALQEFSLKRPPKPTWSPPVDRGRR